MAKENGVPFEVWGDGKPMREFLYSTDVARVCVDLLSEEELPQRLIVSGEHELEIRQLVEKICNDKALERTIGWFQEHYPRIRK